MKIYTRTGDGGDTGLTGGARVSKASPRVAAYGTVDELNAALGMAASQLDAGGCGAESDHRAELSGLLHDIQPTLFEVGAELALPQGAESPLTGVVGGEQIQEIEQAIDRLEGMLEPLRHFILPGGAPAAAALHLARAICRRAERECVALSAAQAVRPELIAYMNRLSDLLFVMARAANADCGVDETIWRGCDGT